MTIEYSATVPSPFGGGCSILQKVVMNDVYQPSGYHEGFTSSWLDNVSPYPNTSPGRTADAPSSEFSPSETSISINRSYTTSNMFTPDGGVPVPLLTKNWSWNMQSYFNSQTSQWVTTGGVSVTQGGGTPFDLPSAEFDHVAKNNTSYPFPAP